MERDLEIVTNFAARASRRSKTAARYDVVGLTGEFVYALRAQLDYLQEARNAERFSANFAGDSSVQIPRVFPDLTTSRVITLERIRGMKITDLTMLDEAGLSHHAIAERTALITAKMIFEDGFFHADPHPGNFFIEPTGRVGIVDFGMVGSLDDRLREQLGHLLSGFVRRDPGRLADALLALGTRAAVVGFVTVGRVLHLPERGLDALDRPVLETVLLPIDGYRSGARASPPSRCEPSSHPGPWRAQRRFPARRRSHVR